MPKPTKPTGTVNQNYDQVAEMYAQGKLSWEKDAILALLRTGETFDASAKTVADLSGESRGVQPIQGRWFSKGLAMGLPVAFQKVSAGLEFQIVVVQNTGNGNPNLLAFIDGNADDSPITVQATGTLIIRPVLSEVSPSARVTPRSASTWEYTWTNTIYNPGPAMTAGKMAFSNGDSGWEAPVGTFTVNMHSNENDGSPGISEVIPLVGSADRLTLDDPVSGAHLSGPVDAFADAGFSCYNTAWKTGYTSAGIVPPNGALITVTWTNDPVVVPPVPPAVERPPTIGVWLRLPA